MGAWGLAVAIALLVLVRGKDAAWDFRNYHWYNPYAWLTGRRGFDVAVAQHATYYNPLTDLPIYTAAQIMPGWLVGVLFGLVQGLNAVLLYELAHAAFDGIAEARRSWIALAIAAAGMLGGMALLLAGVTSHDLTVSVCVLAALVVLMRLDERTAGTRNDLLWVACAGLAGGAAVGLKLTMVPYALGLAAGVAALAASWRARLFRFAMLGAGGVAGALIFGGFWAFTLWQETGNPVFPYFNDVIGSPLLLSASYRDTRFLPQGIWDAWTFPFSFTFDWARVAEFPFRDVKIMIAYVAVPIALVLWASGRPPHKRVFSERAVRLLFAFAAASYVVWLNIFAIYRYAVTLEMLAPLITVVAIDFVPLAPRWRALVAALVLIVAIGAIRWDTALEMRPGWGDKLVSVDLPPLAEPGNTMVLMAGVEPLSYIVPSFPPQIPFLRVDSWLDSPQSNTPFGQAMRTRIAAHRGLLFGAFIPWEGDRAAAAFVNYGLTFERSKCSQITSNVGEPILWCALERRGG